MPKVMLDPIWIQIVCKVILLNHIMFEWSFYVFFYAMILQDSTLIACFYKQSGKQGGSRSNGSKLFSRQDISSVFVKRQQRA